MEKVVIEHTIEELKTQAKESPEQLSFIDYSDVIEDEDLAEKHKSIIREVELWSYYKTLFQSGTASSAIRKNAARNRFIKIMTKGVFIEPIAKELGITKQDVIYQHSLRMKYLHFINTREEEWVNLVKVKAKEAFKSEYEETREYLKNYEKIGEKSLFKEVLFKPKYWDNNPPPQRAVRKELNDSSERLNKLREDIEHRRDQASKGVITAKKLRKYLTELKDRTKRELRHRHHIRSLYYNNIESRKRNVFLNAFPEYKHLNDRSFDLIVSSPFHGECLVIEYAHWFNEKYQEEIEESRKKKKAETDKAYYHNKPEVIANKERRKAKQDMFINMIDFGLTQSAAAKIVGISTSTASNWARNPDLRKA